MYDVKPCPLPDASMLFRYANQGCYTDCFTTATSAKTSIRQFISAFYSTKLFKLERFILHRLLSIPSTNEQLQGLAKGTDDEFSAWRVETRSDNQLLMCDYRGRTRSWFMVIPDIGEVGPLSRLYFGSAIIGQPDPKTGILGLTPGFSALLRFHRIYSRMLLKSAKSSLEKCRSTGGDTY